MTALDREPYTRPEAAALLRVSEPAVLLASEVAEMCRVSVHTIFQMGRDGRLPRIPGIKALRIPRWAAEEMAARMADDARDERIAAALVSTETCAEANPAEWRRNHGWSSARRTAIREAGGDAAACARCGDVVGFEAEVNHIVPVKGKGYGRGCHNHQSNLEVLCHDCHTIETTRQLQERRTAR